MARILRLPAVIDKTGKSRSPIYADIQAGVFPTSIKLGARAAGWPEHEVDQINAARIAGANDETLRKLVAKLHEQRKTLADGHVDIATADRQDAKTSAAAKRTPVVAQQGA